MLVDFYEELKRYRDKYNFHETKNSIKQQMRMTNTTTPNSRTLKKEISEMETERIL